MLLPDKVLAWQSWASQTKRRRVNMERRKKNDMVAIAVGNF
jgi:hypothetical protein